MHKGGNYANNAKEISELGAAETDTRNYLK